MSVPIAFRLAVRQWLARPLRPVLCSLAIAAAVALIVCVGAGMDSLQYSLRTAVGQMLGVADVHVRHAMKNAGVQLTDADLEKVRGRKDVELAVGRQEAHVTVTANGETRLFDAVGVDPTYDELLRPKIYDEGKGHALTGKEDEIAMDAGVAEGLKLRVGDKVTVSTDGKETYEQVVVGIGRKPSLDLLSKPTVYLPLRVLAGYLHSPPRYNVIDVKLRDSSAIDDFDAYAARMSKELGPEFQVQTGTNSKAKLNEETKTIQIILSLVATIAAICAALIIGTTLSVGVQERVRQFGQFRCIGASRMQLVTFLLGDATVMFVIGETLGLMLGVGLSRGLVWYFPQLFLAYKFTWSSMTIAVVDGCFATLLGAAIPIWQVTRVSPMAAVAVLGKRTRPQLVWRAAAAGGACLVLQMVLWFAIPNRDARFFVYVGLGVPLIFVGWSLMGPAVLKFCEATMTGAIGGALRVRPALLRNAWSGTPWRAGAMIAALMIGVTFFTTVRARGQSLLNSWVSPAQMPDLLAYSVIDKAPFGIANFLPDMGIRGAELAKDHPEIADYAPVVSFSVKIKTTFEKGGDVLGVDTPHFIGVEPKSFSRLVQMEYVEGDPETAIRQLAGEEPEAPEAPSGEGSQTKPRKTRYIFVSKDFYNLRGLGVGKKLELIAANGKPVEFTIAAVVTSTGMELVKNYFDMRSVFREHAVTSVVGNIQDAREFFKVKAGALILMNLKPGTTTGQISSLRGKLEHEFFLTISSTELKAGIRKVIVRVVDTLSVIALGALIVASLGVANMVIASIHARRYEFGVLRAIGAGRGQLIRLVLAEVTLIGIVAGVLGAAAGLHFAAMGGAVDRLLVGFQSHFLAETPVAILWSVGGYVGLAMGITVALAWMASIGPAVRGAFSAQRVLLASGRG